MSNAMTPWNAPAATSASVKRKPLVIDCHAHYLPRTLIEAFRQTPFGRSTYYLWESPAWCDAQEQIRMMDAVGVDVAVLIDPGVLIDTIAAAGLSVQDGIRFYHDEVARVLRDHPDRFVGAVMIDPNDPSFTVMEIQRCIEELGFKAVTMVVCYDTTYIDNQRFWPIFEAAQRYDVPIFAHPAATTAFWKESQGAEKPHLRIEISMLVSTTVCIGRFVMLGIYDRFPTLNVVFGQAAGFIPFLFGRFDFTHHFHQNWPADVVEQEWVLPARRLGDYRERIFADTHTMDSIALECARQSLGENALVIGGDFPISRVPQGIQYCLDQADRMRIDETARRKMLGGNAARLLHIPF